MRILDGNLLRIAFLALCEGLRFLHFMSKLQAMKDNGETREGTPLGAFSSAPSMAALLRTCNEFKTASAQIKIMLPEDPLRPGYLEAASALVERFAPRTDLVSALLLAPRKATP